METQWEVQQSCDLEAPPKPSTNIAALMRNIGAILVIASGFIYLLQGVNDAEGLIRDWVYIGLIAAFIAGGLFSQRLMNDTKGARLFFGLGLVAVPVQFAQVAGLFIIEDISLIYASLLAVISLVLGLGTSALAFAILNRPQFKLFSALFVVGNLALLLPTREMWTALVLTAAISTALYAMLSSISLTSMEAKLAALSLFGPIVIMIARAAFNQSDNLGYGFVYLQLAGVLSIVTKQMAANTVKEVLNALCLVVFVVALCTIGFAMPNAWISNELTTLILVSLSTAAFAVWMSQQSEHKKPYRLLALASLVLTCLFLAAGSQGIHLSILLVASAILLVLGVHNRSKGLTIGTAVITSLYLCFQAGNHLIEATTHGWLLLAIAGVLFVGLSSIAEKAKRGDSEAFMTLKACWSDWEF